ncbi:MAG: helix-turn-helix domain-containing protein, partial [Flavobacteriaceae bacterium]|nr:helix-turn-helix domain-containing protein [Flavobacteriaceae bacterium]
MDKAFIHKVEQTILKHIEDELFGVSELASEIGFSQSQLLRKIKAVTGKTVAEFIKEIRLQEAAKLIKEDKYTASEISFKVGFSSPSYFNKCFHNHFGVTPGEYNNDLEDSSLSEKKEKSENAVTSSSYSATDETTVIQQKSTRRKKYILRSLLGLLIIALIYHFYTDYTDKTILFKKNPDKKSIAVLPFKDMSQQDTQWFSDGITDNISSKLAQIKGLTVISRTSSDTYKNSDKKIPRIAKELGVAYILEGSVTIHNNEVKINTKLVNANDKHLWSNEYMVSFDNIFAIQKNVATHVAEQLQINLTTEEEISLSSFPTKNLEAYKNYIKARSFAEKGTKEDFKLSIELFQQAIDLDPEFADAYAEMAFAYIYNNYLDMNNWNQNLNKVRLLIDKTLLIDPNSSKAYSAKGMLNKVMLSVYESKSEKAQKSFEKAIELNPNNAAAHRDIANLYRRTGNMDKSIYHINKATELDPLSSHINK